MYPERNGKGMGINFEINRKLAHKKNGESMGNVPEKILTK